MKLTTKSLKAIKAVLDVAVLGAAKPVPLAEIAKRRSISSSYLESIFRQLREHGLVRSTRGRTGGYRLSRGASAISIADIVIAVDGDSCIRERLPEHSADVATRTQLLWRGLDDHLINYLHSITLATLIDAHSAMQGHKRPLSRDTHWQTSANAS